MIVQVRKGGTAFPDLVRFKPPTFSETLPVRLTEL